MTATSGADLAATFLGTVDIDIVVTDVTLPDLDGVMQLGQARVKAPGVPVIGISGFAKEQTPRLAGAAFDLLLLKPIDPWDLAGSIARLLHERR